MFEFNAEKKDIKLTRIIKKYILGMVFFGLIFSGLTVIIDEEAYIGTHAGYSIINGQAQIYREENERRLELLYSDEKKVIFPSFSNPPELLLFQDITNDGNEWLNQAMAEYYGKESVRRE